jgi:Tol biopolymer transport system component
MRFQLILMLFATSFAPMPTHAQQVVTHGGAPVVSPDGLHIAFLSNRTGTDELFVISTDGTAER